MAKRKKKEAEVVVEEQPKDEILEVELVPEEEGASSEPTVEVVTEGAALTTASDETSLVPDGLFDDLVNEINHLQREHAMQFALKVGELIVKRIYKGDIGYLRQKGAKEASLRKLAQREDLNVSASSLYNSVGVYELYERLGSPKWKKVGYTHARSVLSLPSDEQKKMLKKAERFGWSAAQVQEKVREIREGMNDGRGRPVLPQFKKDLNQLLRMVNRKNFFDGMTVEKVRDLKQPDKENYLFAVSKLKKQLESFEQALSEASVR